MAMGFIFFILTCTVFPSLHALPDQLPRFITPSKYELKLRPDFSTFEFYGTIKIHLYVKRRTNTVVFHAVNITIPLEHVLFETSYEILRPTHIWVSEASQIVNVKFPKNLSVGKGIFSTGNFTGVLGENSMGFYRSPYLNNATKGYMAVTQFEPIGARKSFPCWDEPALKASFEIILEVPHELMALSNMPVVKEQKFGNWKTIHFLETPKMSTYLVAFMVGEFDYVEKFTNNGIQVRVYCPVGNSSQGTYALETAVQILHIYQDFFKIPYQLPKLDMIGIPNFKFGGMENYGLITFQPKALYLDDNADIYGQKLLITNTVAHELGHQWCGNLVTMRWWNDLWLNEGFATWLSVYASEILFPPPERWSTLTAGLDYVLTVDAVQEVVSVQLDINNITDIERIFSDSYNSYLTQKIIYSKGALMVQMMQTYLGFDVFQRSLTSYIKTYAGSTARTEDLWATMEQGSGKPVRHVMQKWATQSGYPIVSVEAGPNIMRFKQMPSGLVGNRSWVIPVTMACGSYNTYHQFLLDRQEKVVHMKQLIGCSCTKLACPWIKINVNQTGFYRARYSITLLTRLESAVRENCLSKTDVNGILCDLKSFNQTTEITLP